MERYHMFKLGLAILFYAAYCIRPMLVSGLRSSSLVTNQTFRPEDYNVFYQGVDGTPGVDFPVLSFIPKTIFSCDGVDSGYYADLDTDCQVFHICEEGKKISFLCPNGTIFEQADLICEWWYKVNCTNAPSLYKESAEFLREDLARRKASRRISLTGQERNHGAVMRIEESASVSAQQNGKPYRVSTSRLLGQPEAAVRSGGVSSRISNNLIQSAIDKDVQNVPQKRYNDADTANFVNSAYEGREGTSRVPTFVPSSRAVEKQVYTRSTTPSSLGGFSSNYGEIPSRKQLSKNRGSIKFSSAFGSKIIDSPGSTLKPSVEEYDLEFPKHKSEIAREDFRPKPSSGSNTVKIDSSKVNLGRPKQKSTVALTRNEILNRRLEPTDSDELQIPQETASFSSNSFNSLQSGARKYNTGSTAPPNHRPTYSDLKRPDFSSTKFVNAINSVTPQYITTQSINSRKPFIGSTVGANIFNRNTGRTQQNEETVRPFSSTESPVPYTVEVGVSEDYSTFGVRNQGLSSTPQPETQKQNGPTFTTERSQYVTGESDGSSNLQHFDGGTQVPSSTPQQGETGLFSTTEAYTVQSGASISSSQSYEGLPSTSQPVFLRTQDEEPFGQSSTTERSIPSTIPPVSSTYQSFEDNSQGSSTSQPELSSTISPTLDSQTTRTVDHATVYGTFSRATTATPPSGGVEIKLGKNVDKVSFQLSKSLGGEPSKDNSASPQLATDGYVRISAGLPQPVRGGGSKVNSGTTSGRGGTFPASQTQNGVVSSISSFISGTPAIRTGGNGIVGSTVIPNIITLAGGASITPAIPVSIISDGTPGGLSTETPETGSGTIQSTTGSTNLLETGTGVAEGSENVGSTIKPFIDVTISQNNLLSTSSGGSGVNTVTGGTSFFDSTGSTALPNVETSTRLSIPSSQDDYGTGKPIRDFVESTIRPNEQGSGGSLGYDSNTRNQPTVGGAGSIPTSDSGSSVSGTAEGSNQETGGTAIPDIVPTGSTGESLDSNQPTNQNSNTAAPPIKDSFGPSTVRPQVGTGTRSQVTDLLPIPEVTSGSTKENNGTHIRQNSFRPNFYPTRPKTIPGRGSKPSSATEVRGSTRDTSYQTTPGTSGVGSTLSPDAIEINFSQNDVGSTLPPAEEISTYKSVSFQNGDSSTFRRIPSTASSFGQGQGGAGDFKALGNTPTTESPFGQRQKAAGDFNVLGNIPTTGSPFGQGQGSGGVSNGFRNIPTTASPFGQGKEGAVTGTGFYVTRGSIYSSTTPSPFGLSGRTTLASDLGSTPLVNISPNSGQGTTVPSDTTPSPSTGDTLANSETRYPRPFQKSLNAIDDGSPTKVDAVTPTYFTYKISSARPFELPKDRATPSPTIPTPFTTARSVQENVDSMINALKEIVGSQDYSSETPRPGLVVPPSAGPQTLHTLAQYFANALDGIVAEREKETGEELDDESKEKLTSLLTQMTMYRYKELFKEAGPSGEGDEETTTVATDESDELHGDDTNNLVETPQLRQLARNFSLALSSYLNDPDTFRKELETFRPTEPPKQSDENTEVGGGEEELLNFSDADSKSSFSPLFPTPQSPSPTWGYILATKPSDNLDVKNSLNPDLHTADTQSFVPGFNNLAVNTGKEFSRGGFGSKTDLPGDHWTTSPGVTKLWQSALSINPAVLNENLDTTRPISHTTEPYVAAATTQSPLDFPQSEIHYDLRSLPKLSLNSTQVHGILIDFVNTTKTDEANRLQRLLKKLNTTEDEFLHRMKEIESNPLTKRLILLLISECGANVTKDLEKDPLQGLSEILDSSSSSSVTNHGHRTVNSDIPELVDPNLQQDDQDTRALQLLNSLYAIASKFGK